MDVNERILTDLVSADDGAAAQMHLAAGFPIYYSEDDTPADLLIKEYPSGKRELVRVRGKIDELVKVLN
ncbi:hypothetical protein [Acinetobacter gerneri]|uniref:Uncharacterized protein n=1 Tax=Acinetobacter gerneri DSM 14967 = CIP 107464 = MTCC 9824 TaxID=1120926 RepID=N8ZUR1_9GAMM|nr:hypothetical protein [Acinetobacter gerneri]ENV35483.1 hypothetical protein F960_00290 [Acinetobacter gerneri DSM 14967 = CIP 107464 = MTCC 9824]